MKLLDALPGIPGCPKTPPNSKRPKDLKTNEEREAWGKSAFADFAKERS
jgi:hypothetical protein